MVNTDVILKGPILVNRNAIFDKIIELMIEAGWENISSNKDTDYFVMQSKNAWNNEDLYVQLDPYSQVTSTTSVIRARCLLDYTPGENGASGTFNETRVENRSQNNFRDITLTKVNDQNDMPDHELSYYVDQLRCVFMVKGPKYNTNHYLTNIFGFGLPVEHFYKDIYPRRDNILWSISDNYIIALDYPEEFGYSLNDLSLMYRSEDSYKNPDWLERINLSEIKYGTTGYPYYNFQGTLWGVWEINNVQTGTIANEDIIMDNNNNKFKVNTYIDGSRVFAIRVE